MTLAPGTRLGPYEISAPLGAGGMGEVYRARDTRLGRDVAVKVLPEHLSGNAEVRTRFEREAKTVSGLNHPNICVLHDVGREGDTDYLVMELIEGETLAERLKKGALPIPEVLRFGSEIADALDRAHKAGVVHRDLKPGNVMLTRAGVKLMDFGLARATGLAGAGGSSSMTALTQSPTVAQPLTTEGTIIGTFQYMAPEQLEGQEADTRADVWALGCVLYEMATGRRAFEGRSQATLITSIMGVEPSSITRSTPEAPPALDRLIRACLAKDPVDRLQSAHDIGLQLSWIMEGGGPKTEPAKPPAPKRSGREAIAWGVAAIAVVAAVAMPLLTKRPAPGAPPVTASLLPPAGVLFSSSVYKPMPLAVSPDGSTVAFCARNGEGPDILWVRSIGKEDARPLEGTEEAEGPFFSPDGRSLGFFADGSLKRVDVAGGPVIELAYNIDARGGTWNRDGVILYTGDSYGPISRIAAEGGPVAAETVMDTTLEEASHRYPHFLPDGKHFLYLARRAGAGRGDSPTIYAGQLGSTKRTAVLEVASNVIYASGHLVYIRGTILVAQPFDTGSLRTTGPAVPLVNDARMDTRFSRGVFAASENGVLLCMTGNNLSRSQLRWLDRSGRNLGDVGEPADYTYGGTPQLSPDGRSAVLPIANTDRGTSDVWLVDLDSGRRRKVTVDVDDHPGVCWVPDGKSVVVMTSSRSGYGLDVLSIDGTQSRRIIPGDNFIWPQSTWGDLILYIPQSSTRNLPDIHLGSLAGNRKPDVFPGLFCRGTQPPVFSRRTMGGLRVRRNRAGRDFRGGLSAAGRPLAGVPGGRPGAPLASERS